MKMKQKDFNWRSPLSIMHYTLALPTFLTLGHLRASSHAARLIGMLSILMLSALTMSCSDDDKLSAEERAEKEVAEQAEKASLIHYDINEAFGLNKKSFLFFV